MPGTLDEALAFGPRPRRPEAICIFTDDDTLPTCVTNSSRSTRSTREKSLPETPVYKMAKSPQPRSFHQRPPVLASNRKTPLQHSLKPPQPAASVRDIPGNGGGKENVPPGMSVRANSKSKSTGSPRHQMCRRADSNLVPTKSSRNRPGNIQKESHIRGLMTQAGSTPSRVPKPGHAVTLNIQAPVTSPRAHQSFPKKQIASIVVEVVRAYWMLLGDVDQKRDCSTSERDRDQSAVIIQRAWRSCIKRKQEHERATATAKMERAANVIARWWRGVKPSKKPEKTPRRKIRTHNATTRQSRGRLGLRRL